MTRKGALEERKVVSLFEEKGYKAVRVPCSGGRTNRTLPDVVAGNGKQYYAVEVKSSKLTHIYIRHEQILELLQFSNGFGAEPFVCAKFTYKPYKVVKIVDLKQTGKGTYVIHREEIDNYSDFTDYIQ